MSHAQLYIAKNIETALLPDEFRLQSADVEHFVFESFGISDARSLQTRTYLRPANETHRQFVVSFSSITIEAQNALLKLLEEPPDTAVFHIIVPRSDILIPTVLSRLSIVSSDQAPIERDELRAFLGQTLGERMEEITSHVKNKDEVWIESIVSGAEEYAHCQKGEIKRRVLEEVIYIRKYISTRGASKKMLLESLSLVLPYFKK